MNDMQKGLCFNYDDNFYRGHVYKSKLFVILMTNETIKELTEQEDINIIQINTHNNPNISFNTLTGQPSPRTLYLTCTCKISMYKF